MHNHSTYHEIQRHINHHPHTHTQRERKRAKHTRTCRYTDTHMYAHTHKHTYRIMFLFIMGLKDSPISLVYAAYRATSPNRNGRVKVYREYARGLSRSTVEEHTYVHNVYIRYVCGYMCKMRTNFNKTTSLCLSLTLTLLLSTLNYMSCFIYIYTHTQTRIYTCQAESANPHSINTDTGNA